MQRIWKRFVINHLYDAILSSCRDADTLMDAVEFVLQNFTEMNKGYINICYLFLFFLFFFQICIAPQYLHAIEVKINHKSINFGHTGVMVVVNHSYSLIILSWILQLGFLVCRDLVEFVYMACIACVYWQKSKLLTTVQTII